MKKYIWIFVFLFTMGLNLVFCINCANAQGNLQFNQVIAQTGLNTACYVVPQGKVFKLEALTWPSAGSNGIVSFGNTCNGSERGTIRTASYNLFAGSTGNGTHSNWPFPQWYPEGTYIYASDNSISINGIEFNIVP